MGTVVMLDWSITQRIVYAYMGEISDAWAEHGPLFSRMVAEIYLDLDDAPDAEERADIALGDEAYGPFSIARIHRWANVKGHDGRRLDLPSTSPDTLVRLESELEITFTLLPTDEIGLKTILKFGPLEVTFAEATHSLYDTLQATELKNFLVGLGKLGLWSIFHSTITQGEVGTTAEKQPGALHVAEMIRRTARVLRSMDYNTVRHLFDEPPDAPDWGL